MLRVDDSSVSSTHAEVVRRSGTVWVKDLNSTNGTYINSDRIVREQQLHEGEIVRFGTVAFILRSGELSPAPVEMGFTEIVSGPQAGHHTAQIPSMAPAAPISPDPTAAPRRACPACSVVTATSSPSCPRCGTSYFRAAGAPSATLQADGGGGLATAGLVCGLVSFFVFPFILGPLGIVFGAIAWSRGHKRGPAATIVSIVGTVAGILFYLYVFDSWTL